MNNIISEQMELSVKTSMPRTVNIRHQRTSRARWWFSRMRQVVDIAMPAQPFASPRPEQTYLRIAPFTRAR